jgi:phosphoribosyl-ATP pyrophosphohydrolase
MNNIFDALFEVVSERKNNPAENSYTSYLFEKGLDKILKKCGEECSEMIIAAKNSNSEELKNEVTDLLFHVVVLCTECGIEWSEIEEVLAERGKKTGNLKQFHNTENDML